MKTKLKLLGILAFIVLLFFGARIGARIIDLRVRGPVLHRAAERGDLAVMRTLLIFGADVNGAPPPIALTPLCLAVSSGQIDAARLLLARGADPNRPKIQSDLPMTLACWNHDGEMIALLREHGARENIVHAIIIGDSERVAEIIEADPERALESGVSESDGWTPIHYAMMTENVEIVRLLLQYGADPMVETSAKRTVIELTDSLGNDEIREMIEAYVAQTKESTSN